LRYNKRFLKSQPQGDHNEYTTTGWPRQVQARRRFCGAAAGAAKAVPLPDLTLEGEVLGRCCPIARWKRWPPNGAQDQRKRKLTCVVFFWLMVLAVGPGGPLSLATLISFLVWPTSWRSARSAGDVVREALSDNLSRRPWQFFEAVLTTCWRPTQLWWARRSDLGPGIGRSVMLVDATVLRVADRLIQAFPGHRTGRKAEWRGEAAHGLWAGA